MIKHFLIITFVILSFAAIGQQKFTISGTISDAANSDGLIGAHTFEVLSFKGTVANNYGFLQSHPSYRQSENCLFVCWLRDAIQGNKFDGRSEN